MLLPFGVFAFFLTVYHDLPMNRRLLLAFIGLLLIILIVAPLHLANSELDYEELQIRVQAGNVAVVPLELADEMGRWAEYEDEDEDEEKNGEGATPDEVELGRLLFFDPLLSANNEVSCASCHHPDLGFADGLPRSVGVSKVPLRRHARSLWNASLQSHFTWDGRANSLQNQMLGGPLFDPDEMGSIPDELLAKLQGNEQYVARFEQVYGELTLARMADAMAAFQYTLISRDSPFDRYAAGDFYALTGAQRRGFEIFRREETNCIRCHELPTFANNEFKVIGVGDGTLAFDGGRGEITGVAAEVGAFSVPSLRNVALSPPYMHNGTEADLAAVIAFYLNGGDNNPNIPAAHLDANLRTFNLTRRELKDLEAFLLALTDESALPEIPDRLPSGLTPVAPRHNPAREQVRAASALPPGEPRTHRVKEGQSIQAAIDIAQPGDTVIIEPGRYFEALDIDVADLTIEGTGVVLMGRLFTPTAITIRNHNVTLVGLEISDFKAYTIDVQGANGTRLENVTLNGKAVSTELLVKN